MAVTCQSPMWRFISTDLDSNITTILDRISSDRHVETLLDVPNWLSFTVPSDSPLVNIPYPDPGDAPYVAEGDRLIYAFRQELDGSSLLPFFNCRAAGVSLQVEDSAQQDDARTKVVAFDPWKLAYLRPAQASDGDLPAPMGTWDGVFPPGTTADVIVLSQLLYTITNNGMIRIDAGVAWGGTAFFTGTIETCGALSDGYTVLPGQSVGDVWTAMVSGNFLDIVLTPIWDPINRPGYTHEMSVYVQAGVEQQDDIFGWDRPPHSLVALSRVQDGTQRANKILFAAGQGGSAGVGTLQTDAGSVTEFGQYWGQQFLPGQRTVEMATEMAVWQLGLRKNGRTTIQFSPTPERSPCPFVDYNLGDRVPVYASASGFREALSGYVRIYGFPIDISDDALEEVRGMILLPQAA